MNLKKIKPAFTLIELLVGMTLLAIMALVTSNLNLNRLSTKQELDIFVNNVKSNFETIRNSSLLGKSIGTDQNLPEEWKIEYSLSNNGTIINSTFDGDDWTILGIAPIFRTGFSITEIKCLDLNGNNIFTIPLTFTGEILFTGNKIKMGSYCDDVKSKILKLTIKNKTDSKILLINTLNGLSEIQQ
ncbi:MAG: type II secretion system protein [Candidatus Gracilibacteria bacterium]